MLLNHLTHDGRAVHAVRDGPGEAGEPGEHRRGVDRIEVARSSRVRLVGRGYTHFKLVLGRVRGSEWVRLLSVDDAAPSVQIRNQSVASMVFSVVVDSADASQVSRL